MAKKLGKLAFLGVVAGAAVGTYYYFQNKNQKAKESTDDLDDFDDFDDDLEDEDFSSETDDEATTSKSHIYTFDLDNAREKFGEKVMITLDKTKEKLEQLNVSEKIDKAKEFIGDRISNADQTPEYTEMDITSSAAAESSEDEALTEDTASDKAESEAENKETTEAKPEKDITVDFFKRD